MTERSTELTAKVQTPVWLKVGVPLVIVALVAAAVAFFISQQRDQRREVDALLSSIADLKVRQIADWRRERIADARVLMGRREVARDVARFLDAPSDELAVAIERRLRPVREQYHFADILVVDPAGDVHLSLEGHRALYGGFSTVYRVAASSGEPVWTPLHAAAGSHSPHLSVVAPLFVGDGDDAAPVGALVLISEAEAFLYPLIQAWPTPSETAETLLVRREGDQVVFLNELRHREDTALRLTIPIARADLPAAMAVTGRRGVVHGKDYRGVEVVAAVQPVPDSPWFMVAKVDAAEAFTDWRARSLLLLGLMAGAVVLAAAGGLIVRQRRQRSHYRELYRAESALREAMERHSITLRAIGDAVIGTDSDGRVELMNPAAERLTGWPADEARGAPLGEVFRVVDEATGEPVEDPARKVLRDQDGVSLTDTALLLARDGREVPIADTATPIRDADGVITGVVLVFQDQTGQREARRALAESEERLRLAQQAAGVGAWEWKVGSDRVYWSDHVIRTWGYDPETFSGRFEKLSDRVHPDDVERWREDVRACVEDGREHDVEFRVVWPDGTIRWIRAMGDAERDGDGVARRMLGVMLDVTDRHELEERLRAVNADLRRSNEELEQFAYVASHDLQEPLRMVSSYTQLLARRYRDRLDDDAHDFIGYAVDGAERMQRLINDLLRYSRVTTRGAPLEPVDFEAVLADARKNLERAIEETGAELTSDELPTVLGDAGQLTQLLQNLIHNAIKFRRQGEVPRVHVAAEPLPETGAGGEPEAGDAPAMWQISVKDHGIGIAPEFAERIFTIFQRLHGAGEYAGTGIGLALCRRIVERHGGTIRVESAPDEGAELVFTLPDGSGSTG